MKTGEAYSEPCQTFKIKLSAKWLRYERLTVT